MKSLIRRVGTAHAGFMNGVKSWIAWAMPTLQGLSATQQRFDLHDLRL